MIFRWIPSCLDIFRISFARSLPRTIFLHQRRISAFPLIPSSWPLVLGVRKCRTSFGYHVPGSCREAASTMCNLHGSDPSQLKHAQSSRIISYVSLSHIWSFPNPKDAAINSTATFNLNPTSHNILPLSLMVQQLIFVFVISAHPNPSPGLGESIWKPARLSFFTFQVESAVRRHRS